ncbi:MAG: hypothetical protein ABEJ78_02675 [Haloferacaceae archaeon]
MVPTRRAYLASVGAMLAAGPGCLGGDGATLVVVNAYDGPVTVEVDVVRLSNRRVVVQQRRTIPDGDTATVPVPVRGSGRYRVQIRTDDGDAGGERTWHVPADESVTLRATVAPAEVTFTAS